ncbi:MAG: uracil-DNA glycosylase family protein [Ekhidna sp.]
MDDLLGEIRKCRICESSLPHQPNPILTGTKNSRLLIIGQAPGRRVNETNIPWDDPSGKQLRDWLGVSNEQFYDSDFTALVPMGFCYPGKGKTGDLPPRKECAEAWHNRFLQELKGVQLTILIGQYAQKYYLKESFKSNLTETVRSFNDYSPQVIPLPHPSPRNRFWLAKNPWFTSDLIPVLQEQVKMILDFD